jgi:hypothetical protein
MSSDQTNLLISKEIYSSNGDMLASLSKSASYTDTAFPHPRLLDPCFAWRWKIAYISM